MKITQQERERYKLDCRARHFASQWLGGTEMTKYKAKNEFQMLVNKVLK